MQVKARISANSDTTTGRIVGWTFEGGRKVPIIEEAPAPAPLPMPSKIPVPLKKKKPQRVLRQVQSQQVFAQVPAPVLQSPSPMTMQSTVVESPSVASQQVSYTYTSRHLFAHHPLGQSPKGGQGQSASMAVIPT